MNQTYQNLKSALYGIPLPAMVVDMDALDANIEIIKSLVEGTGKTLRIASKSVRVVNLIKYIIAKAPEHFRGVMCFSVPEAAFLYRQGLVDQDFLIAYPTVQESDLKIADQLLQNGAQLTLMVDSWEQISQMQSMRQQLGSQNIWDLCIDVDVSYRPFEAVHLGVQRSSIRTIDGFKQLTQKIFDHPNQFRLKGVMGYEAQIAGLGDRNPFAPLLNPAKSMIKKLSLPNVKKRRQEISNYLTGENYDLAFFNGGGTGSLSTTVEEKAVTEVTAGSGFLQSHLFDYYQKNANQPAFFFALQATRHPEPGITTCQSGGFVASGETGPDKNPLPYLPKGLKPIGTEGFGEVQTPLRHNPDLKINIGDPVFFRPAKAGEIAERFEEYLLLRKGKCVDRCKTYRGDGQVFY